MSAALLAAAALAAFATPASATTTPTYQAASSAAALPAPQPMGLDFSAHIIGLSSPEATATCVAQYQQACYDPAQLRAAYGLNPLYNRGITGQGETVDLVDALGSPSLLSDLKVFDAQWGLPPANVQVVGQTLPYSNSSADSVGWMIESNFDAEIVHALAPGAKIVLVQSPVSQTEGTTGFPQMMDALQHLVNGGIGDVVNMSLGSFEPDFYSPSTGYSSLLSLRYAFQDAAAHHVTLVASAGDTGSAGINVDGSTLSTTPEVAWPASDPLVTAAGGTQLDLDNAGNRVSPDVVWNQPGEGATGGGLSTVFGRPSYQNSVRSVVGDDRGLPDLSASASVNGGFWTYTSLDPDIAGWSVIGGTSESAPTISAFVALADQVAGHRLGNINPRLYQLQAEGGYSPWTGLEDITSGDNAFAGVPGYTAQSGYDLASGVGSTRDASRLIYALAA